MPSGGANASGQAAVPQPHVYRWALLVSLALVATYAVFLLAATMGRVSADEASILSLAFQTVLFLSAAFACAYAASVSHGTTRWAWALMAGSAVGGFAGISIFLFWAVHLERALLVEEFTLFLLLFTNGLAMAGLWIMAPRHALGASRMRSGLDALVVGLALYITFWGVAFRDSLAASDHGPVRATIELTYPALGAAFLTLAFMLWARARGAVRPSLRILLWAMVVPAVGAPVYTSLALRGYDWEAGLFGTTLDIASLVLLTLAALRSVRWDDAAAAHPGRMRWVDQFFPYPPLILALVVVMIAFVDNGGLDAVMFWLSVLTVGVVLLRLGLSLHENQSLNDSMAATAAFKTQLLRFISHELANPLSPLALNVKTLQNTAGGQLRGLDVMSRSVSRLMHLSRDVRALAELDAGRLSLDRGRLDLVRLAHEAAASAEADAQRRGIQLVCRAPDGAAWVLADEQRTGQILDNLLSNALKFSLEGGRVTVSVEEAGSHWKVVVEDQGIGLAAEDQAKLFQAFSRANATQTQGLGLGLFLCKGLVEAQGGSIGAESPGRGMGARFHFTVPSAPDGTVPAA